MILYRATFTAIPSWAACGPQVAGWTPLPKASVNTKENGVEA